MILHEFRHERAATAEDAVARLAREGAGARLLAGGTDLLPAIRAGLASPATLVSLRSIAPQAPMLEANGTMRIDAFTRLADLERSPLVQEKLPLLAAAVRVAGGHQIREMGTLGGNLCQDTRCLYLNQPHGYQFVAPCFKRGGECCYPYPKNAPELCWSVYMSDIAPALIALGAEVEILGETGSRREPLEALYSGSGLRPFTLGPAELVRAVVVPRPCTAWGYHKSSVRGGLEFAMAVCAVTLEERDARIVIGAVREKPVRAVAAERFLVEGGLEKTRFAQAAALAAKEANPLPHHGFTKRYLTDNLKVYVRRTLEQALERA